MAKRDVVPFGETLPEDMTFQDFLEAGVVDISEIDDVVVVASEDKAAELVGKSFILYDWEIKESATFGGEYAVCRVKLADGGTAVFSDGGTGIVEQLERYEAKFKRLGSERQPLYFHYGLRKSDYVKEVDGKSIPATTFYFDNRKRP